MKKLKLLLFLGILPLITLAQSSTILPTGLQNYTLKTGTGEGFVHINVPYKMGTYLSPDAAWLQSYSNHTLYLGVGFSGGLICNLNGNVQTLSPVKLGSDAPGISERTFTGVTNILDGAQYVVTTLFPQNKILSANLVVDLGPAGYVPNNYKYTNGYQVVLRIEDNFIYVNNVPGNSYNILNKPFKLNIILKP